MSRLSTPDAFFIQINKSTLFMEGNRRCKIEPSLENFTPVEIIDVVVN